MRYLKILGQCMTRGHKWLFSAQSDVELWVGTRGLVASIKCAATNLIFSLKGKAIALAAGAEAVSP